MRKLSLSLLTLTACMGSGPAPDRSANARWTLTHYLAAVSRLPEDTMSDYKTCPRCDGYGEEPGAPVEIEGMYLCSRCKGTGTVPIRKPKVKVAR